MSIKDWHKDERPREKLLEKGKQSLSNSELLAILIGSGTKEKSAIELARQIITDNKNLITLASKSVRDLTQSYKGIGQAKAITIVAALELASRISRDKITRNKILVPEDVFNLMSSYLSATQEEEFWTIYLDTKSQLISYRKISDGQINSANVNIRKIFKLAFETNSSNIILVHNHPSYDIKPSIEDIEATKKLKAAAELLHINIIDHIIIAGNNFFSFRENELI